MKRTNGQHIEHLFDLTRRHRLQRRPKLRACTWDVANEAAKDAALHDWARTSTKSVEAEAWFMLLQDNVSHAPKVRSSVRISDSAHILVFCAASAFR